MRWITRVATTTLAMSALALPVTSAVAQAAAPMSGSEVAAVATAKSNVPKCVTWDLDDSGFRDHLWVTNRCQGTQRVKVIIAKGDDFSCISYRPGDQWHYEWSYPGRFDRLERC